MIPKGLFITIEGIDGSGKTTLVQHLTSSLTSTNKPALVTKEPGGSILGKELRKVLNHQPEKLDGIAEFLLFAADRAQHFATVIIPALKENKIVISDRCSDSSLAYQGYGRGIDTTMIKAINSWAMQNTAPDLTFYLKLDINTATNRILQRHKTITTFEQESIVFWTRVIAGYEEIFTNRRNVCTLDATQAPEVVATQASTFLSSYFSKK